jgi:hypothetical protein
MLENREHWLFSATDQKYKKRLGRVKRFLEDTRKKLSTSFDEPMVYVKTDP